MDIFMQRRFWVAALPAITIALSAFGVPVTEDMLTATADKVLVAVMGLVSLWSYFAPKPPA